MDKNTWIGFLLIAVIIVGFSLLNRPSKEQLAERQRIQDSIALVQAQEREAQMLSEQLSQEVQAAQNSEAVATTDHEALEQQVAAIYGPFAPAAKGEEGLVIIENEKIRLGIARRGGRIAQAELKEYKAYGDTVNNLCLFHGDESTQSFTLVTQNNRILSTQNLYFQPVALHTDTAGTTLVMRLLTNIEGSYMDFVYTLPADDYMVRMTIQPHEMQTALAQNMTSMEMNWAVTIPQQERGRKFEEKYARLQYMFVGGDMEMLSEQKHALKNEPSRIRWIAYKDQFFSTVMIADEAFSSTTLESTPLAEFSHYIKEYNTTTSVPLDVTGKKPTSFRYYLGPNHYNTLKAYDKDVAKEDELHLKELVPLGWQIVSWINKILVIPMFDLFTSWGLHIGIIILLMTLVIKLIILPFVFASYKSSAKMRVLKPQLDEINAKYPPEKMQERQQATMALYQRAGVSPMSGCLPMLFQFPILMAMFWFLPTAIELRGRSLFWADAYLVEPSDTAVRYAPQPVLLADDRGELPVHLYKYADAIHRPEYEVHEVDDVPYAADVPVYLQRLCSRFELLLSCQSADYHPANDDFPLVYQRRETPCADGSQRQEEGRRTEEVGLDGASRKDAARATAHGT